MVRKYQLGKPITTGGSGYFPLFNQETIENIGYRYITGGLPISTVRQRLYNNLYPYGYNDVIGRFRNAVVNNKTERKGDYLNDRRDPIFAEYLNIPEKDRHKSNYKLVESKYLPTIGKSGSKYYASPTVTAWREKGEHLGIISHLISSMYKYNPLNIGESRVGLALSLELGKHTISRGYDDKGEYVSYYDKWDLSPFGGSAGERDDSRGIGTPVSFYDRIYLDDYYGVKTPTHSTYLPEVIVKKRKHKFGGTIINTSPLVTQHLLWLQNMPDYLALLEELKKLKLLLELQEALLKQDLFGNILGTAKNYLLDYLSSKSNKSTTSQVTNTTSQVTSNINL